MFVVMDQNDENHEDYRCYFFVVIIFTDDSIQAALKHN